MRYVLVTILSGLAACPSIASAAPYTPASQVVNWCNGKTPYDAGMCFGYILATLESATEGKPGMTSDDYLTVNDISPNELMNRVTAYLRTLPAEDASSPAGPSVLRALRKKPLPKDGL